MLKRLIINNVVLIEKASLEFSKGLIVFSGETGAGKSVLMDSLGLVLGARSSSDLIKTGADKLSVTVEFEIENDKSPVFEICAQNGLEITNDVIIRRVLTNDGKNKIFINDEPISLKLLKEVGGCLAEINGQFASQGLLDESTHLNALDAFGGYDDVLKETAGCFEKYKNMQKKLHDAVAINEQIARDEDTLRHYQNELENMHVRENEENELNQKRNEMMHATKLVENLGAAYQALQGQSIAESVRRASGAVDRANRLTDNKYQNIADMLDSVLIELNDISSELETACANMHFCESDINAVEERYFALKSLARKHTCGVNDLPQVLADIESKLKNIEKNGEDILCMEKELIGLKDAYCQSALKLRACREHAAEILSKNVTNEFQFLKMDKAEFRVCIENATEADWCKSGMDKVHFEIKTNAGEPFGELSKIASGGELARFMLALKVSLAHSSGIETMVFDEIDSGVGGSAAEAVGNRLLRLSQSVQVMAVTHSPQVASFSTTHFKVSKHSENNQTVTDVVCLSDVEKKEEIARMLSGEKITDEARAAADKLIEKSA